MASKLLYGIAFEVEKKLKAAGIRVQVNARNERMSAKIRNAQKQKIPYMLVVGDQEVESGKIALRYRSGENPGPIAVEEFIAIAKKDILEGN